MQLSNRYSSRVAALSLAMSVALLASTGAQSRPGVTGTWLGTLKAQSLSLRIVFNISSESGKLGATIDSPDQGAKGLPASAVSLEGSKLRLEAKLIKVLYEGELAADGRSIKGTWTQNGMALSLDLAKQDKPFALSRPQEPVGPLPYKTEEVSIVGKTSAVRLVGSLTIPKGKGPFPAVILLTGSGQQNRDEEIMGHKPFLVLADYLARRGIMSLRCDDRGVGGSTGEVLRATSLDFADDAQAELDWLVRRPEVKKGAVGLIGHSEGGILASIVASRDGAASFVVLLAGPGMKGESIVLAQGRLIARAQGASEAAIEESMKVNKALYAAALAGSEDEAKAKVKKVYLDWAASNPQAKAAGEAALEQAAEQTAASLTSPWYRTFLALDPADYLAKVAVPVLALNGSKDLQVPAGENLAAIKAALKRERARASGTAGGKDKLVELEGLNHLFQHATSGSPAEYGTIEETFAPEALKAIGDWILSL